MSQEKTISSLHQVLEPHLLRRVKQDVEKSLPKKREQILRVPLTALQKKYYRLILTRNFRELNKGTSGNYSSLINIVMELKKCCNHPFLFAGAETASTSREEELSKLVSGSGKLKLIDQLLTRLRADGHRVLIFSQMVRMLDILYDYCRLKDWSVCRLDGSMNSDERQRQMDSFNAPDSRDFIFLLSTRAGGLGINLATADTVIIYDSDWNPQNDLQAEARAHRIGQTKVVNIYRLVTGNTIEENILERARQKMILDQLVIQQMDKMHKKDLAKILQFKAEEIFQENSVDAEVNIEDILARAEETTVTGVDAFFGAFKVANFSEVENKEKVDNAFWKKVVPSHMIPHDQVMDESAMELSKQLEIGFQPRKAAQAVKSYSENTVVKAVVKADAAPKKPAKATSKPPKAKAMNESKLVKLIVKTLMSFGNRPGLVDLICSSSPASPVSSVQAMTSEITSLCENAEEPKVSLHGVEIDAAGLIERINLFSALATAVENYSSDISTFRLTGSVAKSKWKVSWGVLEDSRLLLAVYHFGFRWEKVMEDEEIRRSVTSNGQVVVKNSQLQNRVLTLMSGLVKKAKVSPGSAVVKEPKERKEKKEKAKEKAKVESKSESRKRGSMESMDSSKRKKSFDDRLLLDCKTLLMPAKSALKSLYSISKDKASISANLESFSSLLSEIGKQIASQVSSSADPANLERHMWYYVKQFVSGISFKTLRRCYGSSIDEISVLLSRD